VDSHALAALEYPAIAERLAQSAATEYGASLARELQPSPEPEEVRRRQRLTAEAIALLDEAAEPSLHGVADVREAAMHASRGGVLATKTLREVARTISTTVAARGRLEEADEIAPELAELAVAIDPSVASIADAVGRCVEEDGSDLRDTASPQLRRLRTRLRNGRQRVADELRRLARGPELRDHLQEQFVTERGGRPVLAVRASARGHVRGIVHDASSSGQTLFIEPFAVVELNNELSEVVGAERDEVDRILGDLSAQVGARSDQLSTLVEAAGAIDLVLAAGAVSRTWRGAAVQIGAEVRLSAARHPLLDPAATVPIDLELGRLRALVISGPNAGGKTVGLKTLGLAALLHQAGLRPPAEVAVLPVFDEVLADIGDEQSIAMNLSTFSAHVNNLVAILEAATDRSLVLVDELASGTDPVEGSSLARALLDRLATQARLTVVTTHYPELKEWASARDDVANAATGFDPDTHEPLYRIMLGRPGTSHALRIAERLGLDEAIVEEARGLVAPERLRITELLAEAEAAERAAADALQRMQVREAEVQRLIDRTRARESELGDEIDAVRASAATAREEAVAEARRELADARAELAELREEIRVARRRDREARRTGAAGAQSDRDRRLGAATEHADRVEQSLKAFDRPIETTAPLAPGDPVVAQELGVRGTIAAIEGTEAEVVGQRGLRVRIPVAQLRPDGALAERETPPVRVVATARPDAPSELDVRGRRAQEAREAVRTFVDDAALAGLPQVRVIHGRGTGSVRNAVRDELRRHALVERQEPDSADGATVVHLGS
jgi:DNA mismatch repair protein MutS2